MTGAKAAWTRGGWTLVEVAFSVVAFAMLCVVILRTAPFMPEPDDQAYRGSIVAMTDGDFLTLSTAQVRALSAQVARMGGGGAGLIQSACGKSGGPCGGVVQVGRGVTRLPNGEGFIQGIAQWVQLPGGRWISEKDPGFPFLAAAFQALGIIRWDQLFYGALACVGLFFGARRWLGRFGGAAAVGLYCTSGAAMLWGWRDYMPTFTDASLIAAGTGALLWAVLAIEARPRWRTLAGLAGFVALEAAAFTRYTDVLVLGCAVVAVAIVAWRGGSARVSRSALWWWLGSVVVFCAGVALFDDVVYGGPLQSGYRPGEIQFSFSAIGPNIRYMPAHLMQAMPVLVLGLTALAWILAERARLRGDGERAVAARTDLWVAVALFASWFAIWGLYAAYTWTTAPGGTTLQLARFYVPALGAISLLGAWLITRVPRREALPPLAAVVCAVVIAGMFVVGDRAFHDMLAGRDAAVFQGKVVKGCVVQGHGQRVACSQSRSPGGPDPGAGPGRSPGSPGKPPVAHL